jgi:spore germination protein GerM
MGNSHSGTIFYDDASNAPSASQHKHIKEKPMTLPHLAHPLRKVNPELLILLVITALLTISVLVINLIHQLPKERTVPAPVVASSVTSSSTVPLHFSKAQGSVSVTEVAPRPLPTGHSKTTVLQTALEELLAGPTAAEKEAGYYSEIPKGTRLLGVQVQHNIVHINLSKEFTQGGGSTSMLQRVNEIKDTVHDVEGGRPIELAVEGKPLHVLGGEGLEVDEELNAALN